MRSISRIMEVSINTVAKLQSDAGQVCADYHHESVRNVSARNVQCDEIWSFNYAKARTVPRAAAAPAGAGDVWTWTAIDADSKLIVSWQVGARDGLTAYDFMQDLRDRLTHRVQLTTDGLTAYIDAVELAFGSDVDYAQLIKYYGPSPDGTRSEQVRYSPSRCVGTERRTIIGWPEERLVNTSYVERHNLTMRMSMRRFSRLTNAFSKRLSKHIDALSLYFVWYNFCRKHQTLGTTPAVAAGLTEAPRSMEWVVDLVDASMPAPARRGPYNPRRNPRNSN